ncbi:MAG: UDP-N-acetylmuramoyl-tripeptide--D-alanyl-D-alanine ligase, partial [Gammaproteobacteria bacterium]|nr:UDP-N-acetylmuramoyl-tripeptide--D-alanyl-D-alanine ligase [Gammaproteobacteria bacterium]
MIKLSLAEISILLNCAKPKQDATIHGISKDTRSIMPGNLYIAIKGEQFDGHHFITDAAKKGASAALVTHHVDANIPQIIVKDTIDALGQLSAYWRNRFSLPLIGVTGSNGKTTLKNMIASILKTACDNDANQVLATEGNLNNNIGLPLMLSRLDAKHKFGVLEMGMNHFNEISYLTHLTKPLIAVINNAAESHLEEVKNIAGVAKAKGEIFQGLPQNGIAILNHDDAYFNYWKGLVGTHTFLTFGMTSTADVYAKDKTYTEVSTDGCAETLVSAVSNRLITIHTPQGDMNITLPLLGTHNIMNALAATAAS